MAVLSRKKAVYALPENPARHCIGMYLYNFLLTLCLPVLLMASLLRKKYRGRTLERLGLKTKHLTEQLGDGRQSQIIWVHALSVGEVTSALPLVKGIREQISSVQIVFTASTRSGKELAEKLISPHVDCILFSPFDLRFAVRRYLAAIKPDCFILVETDFWPNWLHLLHQAKIPSLLVNGRISAKSFATYTRFAFFFKKMFRCFDLLSMQTKQDQDKMLALGIPQERLIVLGNLKYDVPEQQVAPLHILPENKRTVWVCGSTHPGEEEVLFSVFKKILQEREDLYLLLAPRQISRGKDLLQLAGQFSLRAELRSSGRRSAASQVLIVDTIGELAGCYSIARVAFIGGSLVKQGGHNPLEAAVQGVPVFFGPHMEDFAEIARDLLHCGAATTVHTEESLYEHLCALFADEALHKQMSTAARQLVAQERGGVERHLQAINKLLQNS